MSEAPDGHPVDALFVYGLLRPGERLHHVVAPFVVEARPAACLGQRWDEAYPAARFGSGRTSVDGWLLRLDPARLEEALRVLDDVEDEGVMYRRVIVRAVTESGAEPAWAYEWAG